VLEALALGTPIISTRKGAEGLDLVDGRDLLLADTAAEFAAATLRVLSSPALRHELSTQGRQAVARYDWSHSVAAIETLIDQAVAAGGKRAPALR
jgi:polysaccharide biosynthesis protein PslH